jgi:cephalosporin-C deacetylase-like acetyl esterase
VDFIQAAIGRAEFTRRKFWSKADTSSIRAWNQSKEPYRRYLWEEVFGKLRAPSEPLMAQTRLIYDRPRWAGHEVVLPLFPDVFAYGILLVPKDLKPGEKRPLVVCQHGRGGRPQDLIEPDTARKEGVYKKFAAQLADRGFIVYAPQNPYIFEERYRYIQRKANPLKLTLFSFILSQHERTLDWLAGLPFVDAARMGYYGLSYGGKTAVRVPPLLDRYALSICSGDFNEYTGKIAGIDRADSFMYTYEHEMYEFNLGSTFNYSDMANLMAPRPFMVERGHKDGVGMDEWVAYEYAKVKRFYTFLGIPERTTIEFFNGPHEINATGTFRFLHEQLNWPAREATP